MDNLRKMIEDNPTHPVRRTIWTAHQVLRLIGWAMAEWTCHREDLGSYDALCDLIDLGHELGLSESDMTRAVIKGGE